MADTEDLDGGELQEEENDAALVARFADPQALVDTRVPDDLKDKYEFFSYKNAAVVLSETRVDEWAELIGALRDFRIDTKIIRSAGGNESEVPSRASQGL